MKSVTFVTKLTTTKKVLPCTRRRNIRPPRKFVSVNSVTWSSPPTPSGFITEVSVAVRSARRKVTTLRQRWRTLHRKVTKDQTLKKEGKCQTLVSWNVITAQQHSVMNAAGV